VAQYLFDRRGATVPLWTYTDSEAARTNLEELYAAGATHVIIDFHLTSTNLRASRVEWEDEREIPALNEVISLADEIGLEVAIKPIVIIGNSGLNWQSLDPSDKESWFRDYEQRLLEAVAEQPEKIRTLVITNELRTLTTDPANETFWIDIIRRMRESHQIEIGFNAGGLLGDHAGESEFELISNALYAEVDFVGISAYPRVDGETSGEVARAWLNDSNGLNQIDILRNFADGTDKPIYFTELGVAAIRGGNFEMQLLDDFSDFIADFDYSQVFYEGTFLAISDELTGVIDGVFIYSWSLSDSQPLELDVFNVNHQTSKDTIKDVFTSGLDVETTIQTSRPAERLFGTGSSDEFILTHPYISVKGYDGDDRFYRAADNVSSHTYYLNITVNGDILDGIAPTLQVRANDETLAEILISPIVGGYNEEFGGLPYTTNQSFEFLLETGDFLSSLDIRHINDDYQGFGLDRNARIVSLSLDGIRLDKADFVYFPDHEPPVSGTEYMFDGGRLSISSAAIENISANRKSSNIDGGEGLDTVMFEAASDRFTLAMSSAGPLEVFEKTSIAGPDILVDVEVLEFSDASLNLNDFRGTLNLSSEGFMELAEVYAAYFNRAPDAIGLYFWGDKLSKGMPIGEIAELFFDQAETRLIYADVENTEQFLGKVYSNVLGRSPDPDGFEFWISQVSKGAVSEGEFVLEVIRGAKNGGHDADINYLSKKADLGVYFSSILGMSDIPDARDIFRILGDASESNVDQAKDAAEQHYADALNPTAGDLLFSIHNVVDNPFEII
jgi:hypothetical protein